MQGSEKYVVIPIEVWELLENKIISFDDFRLLRFVNFLCKRKDGEWIPCYASISYLAQKIGESKRQCRRRTRRLLAIGLLLHRGWRATERGRIRLLETAWTRTKFGKGGAAKNGRMGVAKNGRMGASIFVPQGNKELEAAKAKEKTVASFLPTAGIEDDSFFSNGHQVPKTYHMMANILHSAVLKFGNAKTYTRRLKPANWAKEFAILSKDFGEEQVLDVLLWYSTNLSRIGEKYFPVALSGKSFKEKYVEQLLPAMRKAKTQSGELKENDEVEVIMENSNED